MLRPLRWLSRCLQRQATLHSQAVDTARVPVVFAAVTTLRNDYERSYGRFVTVHGIRMQLRIPAAIFGGASKGGFVAAAVFMCTCH